ncbi:MAG: HD domain-containing phosphohydrolase [Armatimonadota bacterium]
MSPLSRLARRWNEGLERRVRERTEELHRLNLELEAEIGERRCIEDSLRRRAAFEQEIAALFANFINLPSHKLDQEIARALEVLARHTGADVSVLWELTEDGGALAMRHQWVNEDIALPGEPRELYPVKLYGWWMDRLRSFEPILVSCIDELPDEAMAERAAFRALGLRSVMAVPVASRGWLKGFLALWAIRATAQWEEDDVPLVRLAGEALASALERQRSEQQVRRLNSLLEKRIQRLNALRQIDICIATGMDLHISMGMLLSQAREQLGAASAVVLLLDEESQTLGYTFSEGVPLQSLEQTRLKVGEQFPGQAALTGEIIRVDDLETLPQKSRPRSPALLCGEFRACCAAPLKARGTVKGALELLFEEPISPDREWLDYLAMLASLAGIAIDSHRLVSDLQQTNRELIAAYDATIEGWSRALDLRDRATWGHSDRVASLTVRVARRLGVPEEDLVHIRRGALLHDIGKMATPDTILLKPGKLTEEERAIMEQHTTHAYEMLSPIEFLRPALDIPFCHHERWDGSGYPRGLKGEEIPLGARVFAVVDVFDALTSDRPYRSGWSRDRALEHICGLAGSHFDPRVVEAFMQELLEHGGLCEAA